MNKIVGEIPLVGQRQEPSDDQKQAMMAQFVAQLVDSYAMEAFKAIMPFAEHPFRSTEPNGDRLYANAERHGDKVAIWCYRHAQRMLVHREAAIRGALVILNKSQEQAAPAASETPQ